MSGPPRMSVFEVTGDAQRATDVRKPRRRSSIRHGNNQQSAEESMMTIHDLPDMVMLKIFSFLRIPDLCVIARVSRKWRSLAYEPMLWQHINLRPDYNGIHIASQDVLLRLLSVRFGSNLRYIELPCDLITVPVLEALTRESIGLRFLILDFANAMQLHDYNDLQGFPTSLYYLCICLSDVIFMEGLMRKIYQCLSSLEVLHLVGTFELSDDEEEEIFEVINISKIKAHTPNLRVVSLYGINFVDDSHVELLANNCIHLECVALNFCLKVTGTSLKTLLEKCKKVRTLLMEHCGLSDAPMREVVWEETAVDELDISSTELSAETLEDILLRFPHFRYLSLGHCDFFTDRILEKLMDYGKLNRLAAIDLSFTPSLNENTILRLLTTYNRGLKGVMLQGKPLLAEYFWSTVIPYLRDIRTCVLGCGDGWFLKLNTRVHVDQILESFAQNCPYLEAAEIQWDPSTIRYSDKSRKFIDHIRLKCPHLKSLTLSDGEYYEMVKSNFERADRQRVVRTTTNYNTCNVNHLRLYHDLLFN